MNGAPRRYLVTGGAGFIGSAVVRHLIAATDSSVAVVDKLGYAGNLASLAPIADNPRYRFFREDIVDGSAMRAIIDAVAPDVIMHLAAESHVDRSIDGAGAFIETNVVGTFSLLEAALAYWRHLPAERRADFRFHHVSTDEVFGALGEAGDPFTEATPYNPNSPYAASKAASDHLVRAWQRTYGLPVVVSNCTNNFGPYQFPEKLIPLTILNCLEGRPLPVYGKGAQVRDWLHVEDHVRALLLIAERGEAGATYLVGSDGGVSNLEVVRAICGLVDRLRPSGNGERSERLISFVPDRPGHDFRYAVDTARTRRELGWRPQVSFEDGLETTVAWYLANHAWWGPIRQRVYGGERLGLDMAAT
jgi:dTDP-glucose 4,6-dehydratase